MSTPAAAPESSQTQTDETASTTADQSALILRILKAIETHDYRTLLTYTLNQETDYFGHKNASNAFIQQDMTQDARSYQWCRFVPDLSTFQTSLGHDSVEYDSDALDVRGKEHKARCRLDIYYTLATPPRLQALSLKVLPTRQQSAKGSTVTDSASGPLLDDATIKQQLVGTWNNSGETVVLKANGVLDDHCTECTRTQRWDVHNGVFRTWFGDTGYGGSDSTGNNEFKILSLSKTNFVIQDMYHGHGVGNWFKIANE